jgi:CRP-like cAMP-binding protein
MDTKIFFHYPDEPEERAAGGGPGFLDDASSAEWSTLLGYAQARHLRRGERLYAEGDTDAALYVLTIGAIELRSSRSAPLTLEPPATAGEIAFIDRGVSLETAVATTDTELLRLSQDAFEVLSAREQQLAQHILRDLARTLAHTLRTQAL